MENSNEMKIPDDVDKESKPLDDGEKGSVYTLSLGFDADDVISASDMPNVVNENDNVSENISELIADIDKEIEDENLAVLERSKSRFKGRTTKSRGDSLTSSTDGVTEVKTTTKKATTSTESFDQSKIIKNGDIDSQTSSENQKKHNPDKSVDVNDISPKTHWQSKISLSKVTESSALIGIPSNVRKESLTVPTMAQIPSEPLPTRRDSSTSSKFSLLISPRSIDGKNIDFSVVQMPPEEKKASVFTPEDSWIRQAIPYLPLWVSIVCLILNIIVPGSGTVLSGMCIFCCGKSRIPVKYDQDHVVILCTNTWVGVAQLFTVTFLFVGWFWSLAWGIKMIILSVQRRQELADQRAIELQTMALSAFGTLPKRGV
ncbi:uncharacterized protein LOC128207681 [Mya arenaria]|uniref:uncharacterized protein LOC128207681 n=1 Tax=Mya arenaria TaxID=6604 RepID=UPI0022DFE980|nr:uncharacterized protein LOC128207681 [Mya arenaria]